MAASDLNGRYRGIAIHRAALNLNRYADRIAVNDQESDND